ncbi:MAG TPA: class I SAM-dependent methyltransferase [Micromonosporaceae bacterium]|nr:class I SAM-dependent methyltransferase [Micromonosporaceae bacterium]
MPEPDTNAAIWKSEEIVQNWAAEAARHEQRRAPQRQLMAELLPFDEHEAFTFLDLGAGTGAASRAILAAYPSSNAILADFSPQMMGQGQHELQPFAQRFRYVEFDMSTGDWPDAIPATLDAIVTSMCVHHLPDDRKRSLFAEIFDRLAPGGWYLNYDPVRSDDPAIEAIWEHVKDRQDPDSAHRRQHRSPDERARYENHVRYIIPLAPQLEYLRSVGFEAIDVYWKQLDEVIYGGHRPA